MNIFDSKNILIITSQNPSLDLLASTYALYNVLNSENREVAILDNITNQDLLMRFSNINPIILDELKPKTFILSLDKNGSLVTKLNWKQTDDKLKIYINTKDRKLDVRNVDFEVEGSDIDLIITVGLQSMPQIGNFYSKNLDIIEATHIFNIDNSLKNSGFGNTNYVKQYTSISEVIYELIVKNGVTLNTQTSQCLLTGIMSSTKNLTVVKDPVVLLEIVTVLLKNGADYSKSLITSIEISKDQIKIFDDMKKNESRSEVAHVKKVGRPRKYPLSIESNMNKSSSLPTEQTKEKREIKPLVKTKKIKTVPITIDEMIDESITTSSTQIKEDEKEQSVVLPEKLIQNEFIEGEKEIDIAKIVNRQTPEKEYPFPIVDEKKMKELKTEEDNVTLENIYDTTIEKSDNFENTTSSDEMKDPFTPVDDLTMPIAMEIPNDVQVGPTFNAFQSFNPTPTAGSNPFFNQAQRPVFPNTGTPINQGFGVNQSYPAQNSSSNQPSTNTYNPPQGGNF